MRHLLTGIIQRLVRAQARARARDVAAYLGEETLIEPGFSLDIRCGPREGRLRVGRRSVLGCTITLERNVGSVVIGDNTFVGASRIICAEHITVGSDVLISWGCTIVDHDSHSLLWSDRAQDVTRWREGLGGGLADAAALKDWQRVPMAPVQILDKAWLGFNVIVLKGITIGEGAVVAAGSVVTKDVPDWTVAAGNPARVLRDLPRA